MRALLERKADGFGRLGQIDHRHFMPRRHDRADGKIAKAHHARDHLLLAGFEHACVFRLHDQCVDFFFANFLFGVAALTEQPEQALAGAIENPHQRQRYFCENRHRRCDLHRDRLGIAQRDLLRHKLTDDQRGVGNQRDHQTDAQRIRHARRQAKARQPPRQARAEGRAGKCTGEHADQRDADLDRGQKLAGVGGQCQRAPRAADLFLNQALQSGRTA